MELIERYNNALKSLEGDTIGRLNTVLDDSFLNLVRRTRIQIKAPYPDPGLRKLGVLRELKQLVPSFRPDKVDKYDRLFNNLVSKAQDQGLNVSAELSDTVGLSKRIDISIPIEATVAAARDSRKHLEKHGQTFAETSSDIVAQGMVEGKSISSMVGDMNKRLGVVKSRGETIVRTESLRASNTASREYYAANGIDLVMWYATADDRTCPICAPRAGQIYKRSEVRVPIHPKCRCYLAPWDISIAPEYAAARERHIKDVRKVAKFESGNLSQVGMFEQLTPQPLDLPDIF